jgi:hypothetical protein
MKMKMERSLIAVRMHTGTTMADRNSRGVSLGSVWLLVLVVAKLRNEFESAVEAIVHGDPIWDASDRVLELASGA